jgi:hypothetical protein
MYLSKGRIRRPSCCARMPRVAMDSVGLIGLCHIEGKGLIGGRHIEGEGFIVVLRNRIRG